MDTFNWSKEAKNQWDNRAMFWSERSKNMWDHGSRKDIIPFFNDFVETGNRVLDVGCGDGYGTYKLNELGYKAVGADLSVEMITKAKERLFDIPFFQADIGNLPFQSNSFDAILCINVLEWTEIPALALKELRRVLKPGGFLCTGILGPTAGPRNNGYRRVYGEKTISNSMMPWEFDKLAKEMDFVALNGFGVYKEGVKAEHYQQLPITLKQALTFMWVSIYQKLGE
ncbi:class I SAM-dependent methyltransferase [Ornithinibacillus xuwenensis]|uniref:Class I SAM-dependent methyltransferase n=1 Tax=Ornithinibacillus xuwenensis TaxID=3144668 RepID=A0ABU9XMJ3_9BACI